MLFVNRVAPDIKHRMLQCLPPFTGLTQYAWEIVQAGMNLSLAYLLILSVYFLTPFKGSGGIPGAPTPWFRIIDLDPCIGCGTEMMSQASTLLFWPDPWHLGTTPSRMNNLK